jgi:hypothetical protein
MAIFFAVCFILQTLMLFLWGRQGRMGWVAFCVFFMIWDVDPSPLWLEGEL